MRLTLPAPPLADADIGKGWLRLASAGAFYRLAGLLLPWCWGAAALFGLAGLVLGLLVAPSDMLQSDAWRILFIHLPAVWTSMIIYLAMAVWAGLGLVLDLQLSSMLATALAPTGALMSFVALWTGALWGKPTWGAWWVWDTRLVSELLLLFLYLGFMALQAAHDEARRADRAGAILALVGMLNLPVMYFSVQWWNGWHQGSATAVGRAPDMASAVIAGMLLMLAALWAWSVAAALHRARSIVLERERDADWLRQQPPAR